MLSHLTGEEKTWLLLETMKALNHKKPECQCVMPKCEEKATGRMFFFSAPTKFSSDLCLCDRCYQMIRDAQVAETTFPKSEDAE